MGLCGRKEPQQTTQRPPEGKGQVPRAAGCGTDVDRLVGHGGDDPVAGGRNGTWCFIGVEAGTRGEGGL